MSNQKGCDSNFFREFSVENVQFKMSLFNVRVEAVLLLLCALLPLQCAGGSCCAFTLRPPVNTHQSYDVARLRAHQEKIFGELMCGSVARKAFHKAE
jgi:hypothetical protein